MSSQPVLRIAVVTPYSPLPAVNGGRRRIMGVATGLANRGHKVRLVALCRRPPGLRKPDLPANVELVYVPTLRTIAGNFLDRRRWSYRYFALWRRGPKVGRLSRALADADVVQSELIWPQDLARRHAPGKPTVISLHDIEADQSQGYLAGYPRRARLQQKVVAIEGRALRSADHVVVLTEADRLAVQRRYGIAAADLSVVPGGVELASLRPKEEKQVVRRRLGIAQDRVVLVLAGVDHMPVRDGLQRLAQHLLPRLDPRRHHVEIIGSVGDYARRLGIEAPHVRVRGIVDDPRPYFWAADVGLNPVETGAGSNLKLVEYLAAGLQVLTTPYGLRGFEDLAGDVHVAPIERFLHALPKAPLTPRPASAALRAHEWTLLVQTYEDTYRRLLAKGPRSR